MLDFSVILYYIQYTPQGYMNIMNDNIISGRK